MKHVIFISLFLLASLFSYSQHTEVKIRPERLHKIDHRIFGHFLERPSWGGEFGIEDAVINDDGEIAPDVLKKLKQLEIPVLRFPGGTDVDYTDWTDMIDLPQRSERPVTMGNQKDEVTNRFGYDEFEKLTTTLDCQAIVPINFFDAYLKRQPLDSAALHHVGLVAYANAKVGKPLPDGMKNWPAIRKKNGNQEPFEFEYFQIGNETWALWQWKKQLLEEANIPDPYEWYIKCVSRYVELIEAVDPEVKIIVDFVDEKMTEMLINTLGNRIDYYVFHSYMPWEMNANNIEKSGQKTSFSQLSQEEAWNAMVSIPNSVNEKNMSSIHHPLLKMARNNDLNVAVTEWNWNGWWSPKSKAPLESFYAHGVGVAGYLHAFIRSADRIDIACQSMLIGSSWGITGIRVDKDGEKPPYYHPTGQMTSFYGKHHGDFLLKSETTNVPVYGQPLKLAGIQPKNKVASVDIVATGSDNNVSVFFINRDFSDNRKITVDLSQFESLPSEGKQFIITGNLENEDANPPEKPYIHQDQKTIRLSGGKCTITLPKRSVSVLKIR